MTETQSVMQESAAKLCSRITDRPLDKWTWKIWSWVRANKGSMDSERACAVIRDCCKKANREILVRFLEQTTDLLNTQKSLKKSRKDLSASRKEFAKIKKQNRNYEKFVKGHGFTLDQVEKWLKPNCKEKPNDL